MNTNKMFTSIRKKIVASLFEEENEREGTHDEIVTHFEQCGISESRMTSSDHFQIKERLYSLDRKEYVKKQIKNNVETYSGQLNLGEMEMKIHSKGSLMTCDEINFVARVRFTGEGGLDFTLDFTQVKDDFLKGLNIIEVLKDGVSDIRERSTINFKQILTDRLGNTLTNSIYAKDLLYLFDIVNTFQDRRGLDIHVVTRISEHKFLSTDIVEAAEQILIAETQWRKINKNLALISTSKLIMTINLTKELEEMCCKISNFHRESLLEKCPKNFEIGRSIRIDLENLSDYKILCVSGNDVDLFSDLIKLNDDFFTEFLDGLRKSFFMKIDKIQIKVPIKDAMFMTHPIYYYLSRYFIELITDIHCKSNMSLKVFYNSFKRGKVVSKIKWSFFSPQNQSLEKQYKLLLRLMDHFEPGNYYLEKDKFLYTCESIKCFDQSYLTEDRLIWIYIVDNAITDCIAGRQLDSFEPLLTNFVHILQNVKENCYEMFRVVSQGIVKFVYLTSSYISGHSGCEADRQIFNHQIEFVSKHLIDSQLPFNDLRDLIDVYNEYWINRDDVIEKFPNKFPYGEFKVNMCAIRQQFLTIAGMALSKQVHIHVLITYFRSYAEFIQGANSLEFSWFVKGSYDLNDVQLINEKKGSFLILDPAKFMQIDCIDVPRHYVIDVLSILLCQIINFLGRNTWSHDETLIGTRTLFGAIGRSFLYFKEQPNYLKYNLFLEESTTPFIRAIESSVSYEDFIKRINIIGESFWYLRKQDEIDIELALQLYKQFNDKINTDILKQCYEKYLNKFKHCIESTLHDDYEKKIDVIIKDIKNEFRPVKMKYWESNIKRKILPEALACLAAIWSIKASKDLIGSGKFLKPHCIQILCIFNLISIEKNEGVDNHLAQVLTGQGKSLVLGLLSALLALNGHRVRMVCYSKYLASRDFNDFQDFFNTLRVHDKIKYGTFEEMANEVIEPEVNGKKLGLRQLIKERIIRNKDDDERNVLLESEDLSDSVLLIDEVDVFFSERFYGNLYWAVSTIPIAGLVDIQEEIWEIVRDSNIQVCDVLSTIKQFIFRNIEKGSITFNQFNHFYLKPGRYYLLERINDVLHKKIYSNQSLFDENLKEMVKTAVIVAHTDNSYNHLEYKIDNHGFITYRDEDGCYRNNVMCGYYNTFMYFKLKKSNFRNENCRNYGYLFINSGDVSYARLPEIYPCILGVSGTLTSLHKHEKRSVKNYYNIHKITSMPSFFGECHLKFDSVTDYKCILTENEWYNTIFSLTSDKIKSGVSVLIFFTTDDKMNEFVGKFLCKFERLNKLTENTTDQMKEKYISDAGIANTVTVCTRGMGRGTDFKSSALVEKNGGVHVIQTFYSQDIKEETQIKGRTSRKDNKGSYELVVCKEHLIANGFIRNTDTDLSYETLNECREKLMFRKGEKVEKRIAETESNHKITMDYLNSFFSKKPKSISQWILDWAELPFH